MSAPPPPLGDHLKMSLGKFLFLLLLKGYVIKFPTSHTVQTFTQKKEIWSLCHILRSQILIPSKLHVYYNPSYVHCITTLRNKWPHCWVTSHYVTLHLPSLITRVLDLDQVANSRFGSEREICAETVNIFAVCEYHNWKLRVPMYDILKR